MTVTVQKTDVAHDFDFFFHRWIVHSRRLTKRLQNSNEWEEFDSTLECVPVLGGLGNTDQLIAADGTPIGMSLRFFNRETQVWSIYWVSFKDGIMQPPVYGTFTNGTGIFEGDDMWEGTPIRVRFTWSGTNTDTLGWEQAFSTDNGKTWETNWISTYDRVDN
jgi:hypothetical protein